MTVRSWLSSRPGEQVRASMIAAGVLRPQARYSETGLTPRHVQPWHGVFRTDDLGRAAAAREIRRARSRAGDELPRFEH